MVFHKALVLDGSLQYVKCVPYAAILKMFPLFSMLSYCWVQVSKQQDVRWWNFRWSIPLYIVYVWESIIDGVISTPSCSYSIWNRYCQNDRRILPNILLLIWFYTVEFNSLPFPNDKMYDDAVFGVRFRYPFAMFRNRELIGLFRLLHAHITYEIDTAKTMAEFCRISCCLYNLLRLSSIACRVQTTRCTMM